MRLRVALQPKKAAFKLQASFPIPKNSSAWLSRITVVYTDSKLQDYVWECCVASRIERSGVLFFATTPPPRTTRIKTTAAPVDPTFFQHHPRPRPTQSLGHVTSC